jgi:hypothetical protein
LELGARQHRFGAASAVASDFDLVVLAFLTPGYRLHQLCTYGRRFENVRRRGGHGRRGLGNGRLALERRKIASVLGSGALYQGRGVGQEFPRFGEPRQGQTPRDPAGPRCIRGRGIDGGPDPVFPGVVDKRDGFQLLQWGTALLEATGSTDCSTPDQKLKQVYSRPAGLVRV